MKQKSLYSCLLYTSIEDEPEDEKAEISKAEEIDETPEAAPESEEVTEVLETPEEVSETAVEEKE